MELEICYEERESIQKQAVIEEESRSWLREVWNGYGVGLLKQVESL